MSSSPNARQIFVNAIEQYAREEWPGYLDRECGDDAELRRRIELLLEAHAGEESLLDIPAVAPAMTVVPAVVEQPGDTIGPYKLLQQIGEGGFGVVYLADQQQPVRRKVALKIVKPGMDTRQVIARFEAERQALALMDHPNIARVLDAGETDSGRPYFVMELVQGVPITEFCDEQKLDTRERLELFVEVCRAVQHAHQKGVIHRDLKPTNILVTMRDDRPLPRVIDFGVAKALSQQLTEKTLFTAFGQVIGTPLYMSPEQARLNELDVDTRSDVYSSGVLLYELLTGTTPFDAETLKQAGFDEMRRILREDEPPRPSARISTLNAELLSTVASHRGVDPRRLGGHLHGELDWIVMKALEKDRSRRYESASAFAADVQRFLDDDPVHARPPSATYRLRKFARRNRTALAIATCLFLVFAISIGSIGWVARDRAATRRVIEAQVSQALAESDKWIQQQQWHQARAAAENALPLVAGGNSDDQLRRAVQERIQVLNLLLKLEQVRTASTLEFDPPLTDREFASTFQEFGIDPFDNAPWDDNGLRRVGIGLAAALDSWALARRQATPEDDRTWHRLLEAARACDSDSTRNNLRAALIAEDDESLVRLESSLAAGELTPATIDLLYMIRRTDEDHQATLDLLSDAVRIYPDDFWINWDLAVSAESPVEAIRFYSAARSIRPGNTIVRNNLANALNKAGRLDEAIDEWREAVRLDPEDSQAHSNLGWGLIKNGRFEEGMASYHESFRIDPIEGRKALASTLVYSPDPSFKNPTEAVKLLEQARRLADDEFGPEDLRTIDIVMSLAESYRHVGRPDTSIELFREARRIRTARLGVEHRDTLAVMNKIAEDERALGRITEALELHEEILALRREHLGNDDGDTLWSMMQLARVYRTLGRYSDAIELQQERITHSTTLHGPDGDDTLDAMYDLAHGYAARAENLADGGKWDSALEDLARGDSVFREAIRLNSDAVETHARFGHFLRKQAQILESAGSGQEATTAYQEAATEFRVAVRLDPNREGAFHALGDTLFNRLRQFDEAESAYREGVRLNPDNVEIHVDLVRLLTHLERWSDAEAVYREAIELRPDNPEFHRRLAHLLRDRGEASAAADKYFAAIRLDPDVFDDHSWVARLLTIAVDPEHYDGHRALEAADRAVELEPERYDAWMVLGWARYRAGDWSGSIEALERSCELQDGGNEWQWFFLAMAHWQNGNPDEAKSWYERAARYVHRVQPDAEEPYRFRDEAESLMPFARPHREAIERVEALSSQARLLFDQEDFTEAELAYRELTVLDPEHADFHARLARCLARLDRLPEAEAAFLEVVRLRPDRADWRQGLGDVLRRLGKLADAEAAYREAIRLDPDNAGRHHNFGDILRAQDKLDEAADAYRQAINLTPGAASYHHLARIHIRQGNLDQAELAARKAIELDPENEDRQQFLEEILDKQESEDSEQVRDPESDPVS